MVVLCEQKQEIMPYTNVYNKYIINKIICVRSYRIYFLFRKKLKCIAKYILYSLYNL